MAEPDNMSAPDPPPKMSFALGGAKKKAQQAPANTLKRPRALIGDDEPDPRDSKRASAVTQFNAAAGGAIGDHVEPEKGPMVISAQKNRDWKEASKRKRQRSALPGRDDEGEKGRTLEEMEAAVKRVEALRPGFGLNVGKKRDAVSEKSKAVTDGDTVMEEAEKEQQVPPEPNVEASARAKTEDEEAMEALIGKKTARTDLKIPAVSEEEGFQQDVDDAPEMSTLADYERVPVEDFGAALLRGMGWKDGEGIGSNRGKKAIVQKAPERRPAMLGIGAKEEAAVAQEMGTWGKAAKDRKKPPVIYNPVLMRDKATGETFTEEELKARQERDEKEKYEYEFEMKQREKEKSRRREDEADGKGKSRHGRESERRRRDTDSEDEYRRRKDKERRRRERDRDDSEEEYRRRKEKDRRRRDRERGDRDYDKERSRKHDRDGRRDRSRDRERDRRR